MSKTIIRHCILKIVSTLVIECKAIFHADLSIITWELMHVCLFLESIRFCRLKITFESCGKWFKFLSFFFILYPCIWIAIEIAIFYIP